MSEHFLSENVTITRRVIWLPYLLLLFFPSIQISARSHNVFFFQKVKIAFGRLYVVAVTIIEDEQAPEKDIKVLVAVPEGNA